MSDPIETFRPLADHPAVYNRARQRADWTKVHLPENTLTQAASVNDGFELEARARASIGNAVMRDGDRVSGASALADVDAQTVRLDLGEIYVRGQVRAVGGAVLSGVAMTGDVTIGVRITSTIVTHVEDDALLGLHEGTEAHGEAGGVVEVQSLAWGWSKDEATNDGQSGDLVPVYRLIDGVIIDQTPPAELSVVGQRIELYDYEANGNYIVDGCEVFALGGITVTDPDDSEDYPAQAFSIAAGTANILGAKRTRTAALRVEMIEDPDTGTVDLEPHNFEDGGSGTATITLRRPPVKTVSAAIVTKQTTETVVRGSSDADTLGNASVQSIISVVQGGTTYAATTDFLQAGDDVDWSPAGAAPATGESYDVTYLYLDQVPVDSATSTSVTVSGGVTGEPVFIAYFYKLPRIDRMCLDRAGFPLYLKGQSSADNPLAPAVPDTLLPLATITNTWDGLPQVRSDGVRNYEFRDIHRLFLAFEGVQDLIGLERLRRDLDSREPVAKQGVFVDPFEDDRYRDSGEAQSAAVFGGGLELPIAAAITAIDLVGPVMLDRTDEVIIEQALISGCMKINPYQVFVPPPASVELQPAFDVWEESNTIWDDTTQVFGSGNRSASSTSTQNLGTTTAQATFLRQIPVAVRIEGFGGGENLVALSFDGLDITPADVSANQDGVISTSFTIPAGVTTGTKAIVAVGQGGSQGVAEFVGAGTIETTLMRRITTITRWTDPPPPVFTSRRGGGNNNGGGESERNAWNSDTQRSETVGDDYRGTMDPLAQTFMLLNDRMITGIDVQVCAIGDRTKPVLCELVTVENGIPTGNTVAQCEVDMQSVVVGQWTSFTFAIPVFVARGVEHAFVFKTDDADHSLRIASRGDFDAASQQFIGAQPYIVGVLLSSSNARTWTPHQNSDLTMRVRGAVFSPTTLTVTLGTLSVTAMSDLLLQAAVDLPNGDAWLVFEVEFDDTSRIRVEPNQPLRLDAFYTGDITIRAILAGSRTISPILFPRVLAVVGTLQTTGTYVSRAFTMGDGIRLTARMKTSLPTGSTLKVEYDKADDTWVEIPLDSAQAIEQGWQERRFDADPITATHGRLRLTLTGNPAARPVVSDLRTASI